MEVAPLRFPVGREQSPVARELQAGLVERLRDRLGREHAPLQQLLFARLQALREEITLVVNSVGAGIREDVCDDAIGIDEGTQHAVRDEKRNVIQRIPHARRIASKEVFPISEPLVHALLDLRPIVSPPRKIELELEEFPEFARPGEEGFNRIVGVGSCVEQRDLDERIEYEIVDRRVAVIGGVQVLVGADGVEALGAFVQVADDAGLVELGERCEQGIGILEV